MRPRNQTQGSTRSQRRDRQDGRSHGQTVWTSDGACEWSTPKPRGGRATSTRSGVRHGQDEGQGKTAEDGGVEIPSRMELLRAREIIDELRKRSG